MFKRVLIANRGEIAIRIARAASMLGMETVSVYAPADALSLHTRVTTESHVIGGSTSTDPVRAYLDIESLVLAAKSTDCDCVHPGYGSCPRMLRSQSVASMKVLRSWAPVLKRWPCLATRRRRRPWPARWIFRSCRQCSNRRNHTRGCRDGRKDRLSRDGEGGRRWWRARYANGRERVRNGRSIRALPEMKRWRPSATDQYFSKSRSPAASHRSPDLG